MKLILITTLLLAFTAKAYNGPYKGSRDSFKYNNYYVINNNKTNSGAIHLAQFKRVLQPLPKPSEKYNRAMHFAGWIHFKNDQTCLDTRGIILQRTSKQKTTVIKTCKVKTGNWFDQYSGQQIQSASQLQIDHLVPLKNAYMTGAFEWSYEKRCLYSNYIWNNYHLIPSLAVENSTKSDKSPAEYMPSNKKYHCEYIKNWLVTKYIWNLRMTPVEAHAIQKLITQNRCSSDQLKISIEEAHRQRRIIKSQNNLCQNYKINMFNPE